MAHAILLIYAIGALGTAISFCRTEERTFGYRLEAMLTWPLRAAVGAII